MLAGIILLIGVALTRRRAQTGTQAAEVKRAQARRERQQAEVDRASAEGERELATWLPDPSELARQATVLRKRARQAAEAIAEERIASAYEDLAARKPERRDELRQTAERARSTARNARETMHAFTD